MAKKENLQPPFTKDDPRINRNGRPRVLPELKEILSEILSEDVTNNKGETKQALEVILRALRNKAIKGDLRAIQEVLDRFAGKPKSSMDITTGDKPFNIPISKWADDTTDTE